MYRYNNAVLCPTCFDWSLLLALPAIIKRRRRITSSYRRLIEYNTHLKRLKSNYLFADLFFWDCNILFAFSNSRLREAGMSLPARLMKYCIIRMPEPIPLGLTFFEAICRAIVSASLVNIPFFGNVDSVLTFLTHRFLLLPTLLDEDDDGIWAILGYKILNSRDKSGTSWLSLNSLFDDPLWPNSIRPFAIQIAGHFYIYDFDQKGRQCQEERNCPEERRSR